MPDSNVQLVLNSRDRTSGSYNSSTYNAKGQNIIQGNIKQVTVSEVNFPYDIPNIQEGFNTFELIAFTFPTSPSPRTSLTASVPGNLIITIKPGFYTGSELATAINAEIVVQQTTAPVSGVAANAPTVEYSGSKNLFTFKAPVNAPPTNPTPNWGIWSAYTFPISYQGAVNDLGKDILSIMGFLKTDTIGTQTLNRVSSDPAHLPADFQAGSAAPLVFTQYIDICSPQLCKNQYMSDGSTTNLARRSDVICRLFVCDNVSSTVAEVEGTRPFILNRQYYNARVMRWTVDAAIGSVDINLYDDVGQPLTTTWQPRNFQITFNCHENPREEGFQ
ncbi:MAG: hypothetical protein NT030_07580 [Candidatus Saganbacteria bacterium]|nr:hypothetical protein [Candidatus Saganbacteria bacterium]